MPRTWRRFKKWEDTWLPVDDVVDAAAYTRELIDALPGSLARGTWCRAVVTDPTSAIDIRDDIEGFRAELRLVFESELADLDITSFMGFPLQGLSPVSVTIKRDRWTSDRVVLEVQGTDLDSVE